MMPPHGTRSTARRPVLLPLFIAVAFAAAMMAVGTVPPVVAAVAVTLAAAARLAAGTARLRPAHLWIAGFALLILLSHLCPPTTTARLAETITPSHAALIALLAGLGVLGAAVAAPPPPRIVAGATALCGAVAAAFALVMNDQAGARLDGLGLNPNYLGALLALPLVAGLGMARHSRRPIWVLTALPCLVAIVATQSRGALLAAAAGGAYVLLRARPLWLQALVAAPLLVAVLAFPGLGALGHLTTGRGDAELGHNTAVRGDVALFALETAARHPVRGVGHGAFAAYAEAAPEFGLTMATHNEYLRLAAESGAAALLCFLALLWCAFRRPARGHLAVLHGMVIAYCTTLLVANPLENIAVSAPFWAALGCLLGRPRTAPVRPPWPAGSAGSAGSAWSEWRRWGPVPPRPAPEAAAGTPLRNGVRTGSREVREAGEKGNEAGEEGSAAWDSGR